MKEWDRRKEGAMGTWLWLDDGRAASEGGRKADCGDVISHLVWLYSQNPPSSIFASFFRADHLAALPGWPSPVFTLLCYLSPLLTKSGKKEWAKGGEGGETNGKGK
jgi:hypothetical protein